MKSQKWEWRPRIGTINTTAGSTSPLQWKYEPPAMEVRALRMYAAAWRGSGARFEMEVKNTLNMILSQKQKQNHDKGVLRFAAGVCLRCIALTVGYGIASPASKPIAGHIGLQQTNTGLQNQEVPPTQAMHWLKTNKVQPKSGSAARWQHVLTAIASARVRDRI